MSRNHPNTNFAPETSREVRDAKCKAKDIVMHPLLSSVKVRDPENFHALLMPWLYGPEVPFLRDKRKVPPKNLFGLERNPKNFKKMYDLTQKPMARIYGIWLPSKPMRATDGINEVWAELGNRKLDLVYLDFFAQPGSEHTDILRKLFCLNMLADDSVIFLTFGNITRHRPTKLLNASLVDPDEYLPTKKLITATIENYQHRKPRVLEDHPYLSTIGNNKQAHYVTTEVRFGDA